MDKVKASCIFKDYKEPESFDPVQTILEAAARPQEGLTHTYLILDELVRNGADSDRLYVDLNRALFGV